MRKNKDTNQTGLPDKPNAQVSTGATTKQGKSKTTLPKERLNKAESNRKNSDKATEPKTAEGKKRSGLNAGKDWLFSKEPVVTAAGETVEEFKKLEARAWDSVRPTDFIEEIWLSDVVVNFWRRQRVRRAESAALQKRLSTLRSYEVFLPSDQIKPVQIRFGLALGQYQAAVNGTHSKEFTDIVTELETARSLLASTSLGLAFLIKKVNAVKAEAESAGQICTASELALAACAGLQNDLAAECRKTNRFIIIKSAERSQSDQAGGGQSTKAQPKDAAGAQSADRGDVAEWRKADAALMLGCAIGVVADQLELRKMVLEGIEKWNDKSRVAASVFPQDGSFDRFARAETTYDRRLYRALALLTMKRGQDD